MFTLTLAALALAALTVAENVVCQDVTDVNPADCWTEPTATTDDDGFTMSYVDTTSPLTHELQTRAYAMSDAMRAARLEQEATDTQADADAVNAIFAEAEAATLFAAENGEPVTEWTGTDEEAAALFAEDVVDRR